MGRLLEYQSMIKGSPPSPFSTFFIVDDEFLPSGAIQSHVFPPWKVILIGQTFHEFKGFRTGLSYNSGLDENVDFVDSLLRFSSIRNRKWHFFVYNSTILYQRSKRFNQNLSKHLWSNRFERKSLEMMNYFVRSLEFVLILKEIIVSQIQRLDRYNDYNISPIILRYLNLFIERWRVIKRVEFFRLLSPTLILI